MTVTKNKSVHTTAMILWDLVLITCAFYLAFPIRQYIGEFYESELFPASDLIAIQLSNLEDYWVVLPLSLIIFIATFYYSGVYSSFQKLRYSDIAWLVISSVLLATGILGAVLFLMKFHFVSRSLILVLAVLNIIFLTAEKLLFLYYLRWTWKKGINCKNLLLVGTGRRAVTFLDQLRKEEQWGYRVIGCVDEDLTNGKDIKLPILGKLDDIPKILKEHIVDIVVFIVPRLWLDKIGSHIRECELQGKEVTVALDLYDNYIGQVRLSFLAGYPMLRFETTFLNRWEVMVKRAFDILVSLALIILLSPMLLAIALFIKFTSPGPVFYVQQRCGLNGRIFPMLKFRSMIVGADKMLDQIKHLNEEIGRASCRERV